jgi:hypothetical protein
VANANVALQALHVARLENIAHQAFAFALVKFSTLVGHDTRGVLAAVLQHCQRVVQVLVDVALSKNTYDATHSFFLLALSGQSN